MSNNHEAPIRRLTEREARKFARSFPLIETWTNAEPRPSNNPQHTGQSVPGDHEPPVTLEFLLANSEH